MEDISLENVFKIVIQCSPNTKRSVSEISPKVHFLFTQLNLPSDFYVIVFIRLLYTTIFYCFRIDK